MPESLALSLAIVVALVVVGGFAVGTQWNVRKGDRVLKWLEQGLPLIGERSTLRWMGSSVMELKLNKAKSPFRTAETLILFEPRDVLVLWALARLRGRRDTLIFRSQLRTAPSFGLEILDPHGWTAYAGLDRTALERDWSPVPLTGHPELVAFAQGDPGAAQALIDLATLEGGRLVRLSVHRDTPNLQVHWRLPDLQVCSARDWTQRLRQIGERITSG